MKKTKRGDISHFIGLRGGGTLLAVLLAFSFVACSHDADTGGVASSNSSVGASHVDEEGVGGIINGVYHIYNLDDLKDWGTTYPTYSAIMHACITWDSSADETWKPVGDRGNPYDGEFDGGGHKVSNLAVVATDKDAAFFGCLSGNVQNLGLEAVSVSGTSKVDEYCAGSIVGYNYGGTITNCWSTGNIEGTSNVGGITGGNDYGTITDCWSEANIRSGYEAGGIASWNKEGTITDCYFTGNVEGTKRYAGGIVGANYAEIYAEITDCYSTGSIKGHHAGGIAGVNRATISVCYSTANVATSDDDGNAGGIVGYNWSGTITDCYFTGDVEGTNYAGGIAGGNYSAITACWSEANIRSGKEAGGIAGWNEGVITACYSTGNVAGDYAGGIAGANYSAITACWSNYASDQPSAGGIAGWNNGDNAMITVCYWSGDYDVAGAGKGKVDDMSAVVDSKETTWETAQDCMNSKLSGKGWEYNGATKTTPPTLKEEA